jgi:hypothetical protein
MRGNRRRSRIENAALNMVVRQNARQVFEFTNETIIEMFTSNWIMNGAYLREQGTDIDE